MLFGNPFIHFTNYSINKHNNITFGIPFPKTKDKTNTKWTFKLLKDYFKDHNINYGNLFAKIEDICVKTIISIEEKIFTANN